MTSLTMLNVIMMVEIAALASIQITVSILLVAFVIIRKIVKLGLFPLLLETGFVMMRQIMLIATMMAVIAALTSTWLTALIVLVIIRKTVLLGLFPLLLETGFVTMRQIMLTAIMMVEIAVDMMSILLTALIVNAITMRLVFLVLIP
jgi:hypothetical protein